MSTATCGAAGAWAATSWTACASSTPTASRSAISTCPSAAPTSASAGAIATACSWPPATRFTRSTSILRASPAANTIMHGVDSRYAWWRLVASTALSAFGAVGMWGVVVVFPALQAEFNATRADVSLAYTTTMLGFGAGAIVLGRLIDTRGAFATMTLATVLLASGYALSAVVQSLWIFAAIQGLLIGFGSAAAFIPLVADVSHWFVKRRALAMAICASGNYVGGALWPKV